MPSNEERMARLESINEEIHRELVGIHTQLRDIRAEIGVWAMTFAPRCGMRAMTFVTSNETCAEMRSTHNTLLIVNFLLWVTTIGTMVGFFVTG
jgi:hypothetical protein